VKASEPSEQQARQEDEPEMPKIDLPTSKEVIELYEGERS